MSIDDVAMQLWNTWQLAWRNDPAAQYSWVALTQTLDNSNSVVARERNRWLRSAAGQGNPAAQLEFGERFFGGQALPFDPDTALEWIRRAAEQDHQEAVSRLVTHLYGNVLG
jgi:TPR repeat protein